MTIDKLLAENKAHMLRAELAMILFCLFAIISQNVQQSNIEVTRQKQGLGSSTSNFETVIVSNDGKAIFQSQEFASADELITFLKNENQMFIRVQADNVSLNDLRTQWLEPMATQQISLAF